MRVSAPALVALALVVSTTAHAQPAPADSGAPPEPPAPPEASGEERPEAEHAARDAASADVSAEPAPIVHVLERVAIRGNRRTSANVIRRLVPFGDGERFDADDERLEQARYQLLGTGWFDDVQLSIERGSVRGAVLLVVEVRERNTLVVEELGLGVSEGLNGPRNFGLDAYVGATIAETNLLGTGTSLQASIAASFTQQGLRVRFSEPRLFDTPLALTLAAFFLNAREVYGDEDVLVTPIGGEVPGFFGPEDALYAFVRYHRGGGAVGTGVPLDPATRFSATLQLEVIDVLSRPDAASEMRGSEVVPIDFALHDGTSTVMMATLAVTHDDRDDPTLTRRGRLLSLRADLASRLLGGDYDFFRAQGTWREWIALPGWDHSVRFALFLGAALGDVPVFYHFYASDLSDLQPSRMLELNLDRRTPPNLLGTAIAELRFADVGARADLEYAFSIVRTAGGLRSTWGFLDFGIYGLADTAHFVRPIPGYAISIPIDLTFDLGVRFETDIGLFQFAFSTLLGFVQL